MNNRYTKEEKVPSQNSSQAPVVQILDESLEEDNKLADLNEMLKKGKGDFGFRQEDEEEFE